MPIFPRPIGLRRRTPQWAWRALKRPGAVKRRKPAWFWVWRAWRLGKKPAPAVKLVMYDDVNVNLIPKNAPAVAGYIGGSWPTYAKVVTGWPHAKHLSIAVSAAFNADCLDVEDRDARPDQAAAWVKKQLKLRSQHNGYNTTRPVVYTSAAFGQRLVDILEKAGLKYDQDFMWWSAHYDPRLGEHICGPSCGFGLKVKAHATQFTDKALNRSLDESVVRPGFFA